MIFIIDSDELKYIRDQRIAEGYWIKSFPFAGGRGNYEMSKSLRHWIGEPMPIQRRDDLCTELAGLFCKKMGDKWRMEHQRSGHDDRAFCLGVACWVCDNPEELLT